jgi:1-acyl-sn-glycerol-3-phosphate acyltransferase
MNEDTTAQPPTAREIERRFGSVAVVATRPVILGSIRLLKTARRFGWRAEGLEHLEGVEPPVVLAANHQSHADTAAILGTLPRSLRERTCVAAALDVFGNGQVPSIRRECLQFVVAAGFHAFAFDRHGPPLRSIRTAAELIRHGWNLLLYPEGTRSRTGRLGPFKPGIGVLARFTRRPVVPIHVSGGRDVLPCGATIPRPGRITVRYGPPLVYRRPERPEAFAERLCEQVRVLGGTKARRHEGTK